MEHGQLYLERSLQFVLSVLQGANSDTGYLSELVVFNIVLIPGP